MIPAPRGAPSGGGPTGSAGARGAMLLALAVILGIVLLQRFDTGSGTGRLTTTPSAEADSSSTTRRVTLTTAGATTSTTAARARPKAEVKVLVANGAGVAGLAGTKTGVLKTAGYATLSPVDANPPSVDKTSVQFADGYEAEAREVAQTLTLPVTVVTRLNSPPVAAADLGDAKVVVILGADAGSTSTTGAPGGTTTTAPGGGATTSTTARR